LAPFFGRLFCEATVDDGHDLVEGLAGSHGRQRDSVWREQAMEACVLVEGSVGDLLHLGRGGAPWLVVRCFAHLAGVRSNPRVVP
jgi:hypothetical protein